MAKISTIFIGYDDREKSAYDVLVNSIERLSSRSVKLHCCLECYDKDFDDDALNVVPLKHKELRKTGLFSRPWIIKEDGHREDLRDGRPFSVDFSHFRFLSPFLSNGDGWALFMDCDMLFTVDPILMEKELDPSKAIMCVQHDYQPKVGDKMDAQPQQAYPKKNWSSVMAFNVDNDDCKKLTPEITSYMPGSWLHRFSWTTDKNIGALNPKWNFLVGEYQKTNEVPYNIHYTLGSPFMEGYSDCDYANLWWEEYGRMMHSRITE